MIVGYGIGQYYDSVKERIRGKIHLDYLCDRNWQQYGDSYDGIPVISPEQLQQMKDVEVVIFSGNPRNYQSILADLRRWNLPASHIRQKVTVEYQLSGKWLKENYNGLYEDEVGNRIEFEEDLEDAIRIMLSGANNRIQIGKRVSVGQLQIGCGKNAVCTIGEGTEIEGLTIFATDGKVEIGKDCLFSSEVILRNHDSHHIFDRTTGERINYGGEMVIGNHVWVGYGATLLGSTRIGDNSVVGTMAVTSSTFPREVILAGNPAKVIRKNICWSKDNTEFYNRDRLEECMAKEAYKYFDER